LPKELSPDLTAYFDSYATAHQPYKAGAWCYEDGLVYRGLEALHQATQDPRWLAHLRRLVDAQILDAGAGLAGYAIPEFNIDNILSGTTLIYLAAQTAEPQYLSAAHLLARQLQHHPRTRSGVYWHKLRYPWQIWLDGLYMAAPFQIRYGQATAQPEMVADSLQQLQTALDQLLDPATGLYKHAFDEARLQPWADPITGHNKAFWSRAIGWLAMALVDVAALVGPRDFIPLRARTEALLAQLLQHRQPDGAWLQVLNRPDLAGNYSESSASAMFSYALMLGAKLGLTAPQSGLLASLTGNFLKPKPGGLQMVQICHVAGLGPHEGRLRDGSAAYYLSEDRCADDPKGVGPLMLCAASDLEAA
jgi:unsaturated rhamnogalacturonyl hydrolase